MSEALLEIMEPLLAEKYKEKIEEGKIIAYYDMNLSTGEIAKKLQISEKDVLDVLASMKKDR